MQHTHHKQHVVCLFVCLKHSVKEISHFSSQLHDLSGRVMYQTIQPPPPIFNHQSLNTIVLFFGISFFYDDDYDGDGGGASADNNGLEE